MTITIRKVKEPGGLLGNMSAHPITIESSLLFGKHWNGEERDVVFFTAEALFQALRFRNSDRGTLGENRTMHNLADEKNPMKAKFLAKGRSEFMVIEQLSETDLDNMRFVLRSKFDQHADVREFLLASGDELIVEDCTKRQRGSGLFWGAALIDDEWKGKNWLGRLWMELREHAIEAMKI